MSIEQFNPQFNSEKFKGDFCGILKTYLSDVNFISHLGSYTRTHEGIVDSTETKKSVELEIGEKFSQMLTMSVAAIKSTDDKKKVIEEISLSFAELNDYFDDDIDVEAVKSDFYEKLILALLNS